MKVMFGDKISGMKTLKTIYILDDCEATTFILKKWLQDDFLVEVFNTPIQFLERFKQERPSLCILDVQLNSNRNGLDVLKEISMHRKVDVPFIFISQDDQKFRKSSAFELGALDYIKKPLDKNELHAKIANILTLLYPNEGKIENKIQLDEGNYTLTIKGDNEQCFIKLTPKEFIILKQLMNHSNSIVSREQILLHLENGLNEKFVVDRVVDVHVCNIKKKLGPFKELINSVYGVGYKFDSSKAA